MAEFKVNNNTSDVSKLRKSSITLTHLSKYPFLNELGDLALSVYAISYVLTFFSKLILGFKGVAEKNVPFIVEWVEWLDKLNDIYILGNIDHYFPGFDKLHLVDLYPQTVAKKGFEIGKETGTKYYNYGVSQLDEFKTKSKPFIVDKTNPLISPINSRLSALIDKYLTKTNNESSVDSDFECAKTYQLLELSIQRLTPIVNTQYKNAKEIPSKVSSIYEENLTKTEKNIPKAIANTSLEISNKTLENLGLKELQVPKVEVKIGKQDLGNVNGHAEVKANGDISVGA